jgi:hypothetical protein
MVRRGYEVYDLGDLEGRFRSSPPTVDTPPPPPTLYTFRGGLIVRIDGFTEKAEAFEAADAWIGGGHRGVPVITGSHLLGRCGPSKTGSSPAVKALPLRPGRLPVARTIEASRRSRRAARVGRVRFRISETPRAARGLRSPAFALGHSAMRPNDSLLCEAALLLFAQSRSAAW